MRAVYYEAFKQTPVVTTVPDPTPSLTGVVVKVEATGLCRSDWHGWMGHDPDIHLPHVPGHELAGTIVAAGRDIKNFKLGDRVTVPFVAGCGHCHECHTGHHHICENQFQPGFTAWGSFAEYVALEYADTNLVRLPDSMDYATAASLGCRFVTAFRAVVNQGRCAPGEWVAVHGCGGVGLSATMIAAAMGARVVAIDLTDDKLALAREMGAAVTLNASATPNVIEAVRAVTGGGASLSIDALGHPSTCFNSIANLRRRGRHVQVGLMLDTHAHAKIPMDQVISRELEILGSHGMQAFRYGPMLAMIGAGTLKPEKLIGGRLSLEQAPAALVNMDSFGAQGINIIIP
ncbi:MAG: zinc-dependent alcohol dehydrogenase family protein [Alphaproteobacteria bacterium]|nr:zinc-dependent alcohol dehydrogenase family protein [Alphaproteobacteria bacterium]